jgi:hypothetical protein
MLNTKVKKGASEKFLDEYNTYENIEKYSWTLILLFVSY